MWRRVEVCVCVCVCVEVCVPFNVRSGRLVTVCVIVNVNILDYALQLGRRCVVRKHRHVGAVAAELLAAFKLPCRKDTGKHACEDGKGGWAACKTLKSDLVLVAPMLMTPMLMTLMLIKR